LKPKTIQTKYFQMKQC